jgi:tryptophan synthase alpha chain
MLEVLQLDKKILSIYTVAGFPKLNDTLPVLKALQDSGVDMIELGMPYSDPLADGPIIQKAAMQAIENGMTLKLLFEQIADLKSTIHIPVLLMGYVNTIMQYGVENFCKDAQKCGIAGVILPDLPYDIYIKDFKSTFNQYGLFNVFLVTPQTSTERIEMLDKATEGFLYLVSSASTTGNNKGVSDSETYLQRIQKMQLQSKKIIGFNIKNKETFDFACNYSDGAIIGSAFVNHLQNLNEDLQQGIQKFIQSIR